MSHWIGCADCRDAFEPAEREDVATLPPPPPRDDGKPHGPTDWQTCPCCIRALRLVTTQRDARIERDAVQAELLAAARAVCDEMTTTDQDDEPGYTRILMTDAQFQRLAEAVEAAERAGA
jgi:hypothetical protein